MIHKHAAVLVIATAVGLTACQQADMDPADGTRASNQAPASEQVATTPAEASQRPILTVSQSDQPHLVDGAGQAVYVLAGNQDGSRCDAECENAWPPVQAEDAQPHADPSGLAPLLGTMPRGDGGLHVTWDGQPLYRYAADSGVGATAGHGVQDQWGTWSLVSPEGPAVTH